MSSAKWRIHLYREGQQVRKGVRNCQVFRDKYNLQLSDAFGQLPWLSCAGIAKMQNMCVTQLNVVVFEDWVRKHRAESFGLALQTLA